MPAEIITIASLKGGVGKTTSTYALAAAAACSGLSVVTVDLDPTGGLSNALEKARRTVTIADVLHGRAGILEAMVPHPLGIRTVPGHRSLNHEPLAEHQLRAVLDPALNECDVIFLDTHPHEPSLIGPMAVADRIVIPTALDLLSLRAAALTVGIAYELGVLDRIRGIIVSNAKPPLSRLTESLLYGLTVNGLAFDTVLWFSSGWVSATSGKGELPDPLLLEEAKRLLQEVATKEVPVSALHQFIALAQGRRATAPVPAA